MRWTKEQLQEYMMSLQLNMNPKDDTPDPGPESKLQAKIAKWAKDHGYPCQCFRQSKKAKGFLVPGWPD